MEIGVGNALKLIMLMTGWFGGNTRMFFQYGFK